MTNREFEHDGYLVIRDVLSAAEVESWRELVRTSLERHRSALGLDPEAELLQSVLCLHHPHKLEPRFAELAGHPTLVEHLVGLLGPDVKCMQSQAFVKPPGAPGNPWHQDEGAIPTRDRSLVAAWFALDEASMDNGCLRVVPGTHARGYLYPSSPHGRGDDYDFPTACFGWEDVFTPVSVEVVPGDVVLFDGYLVHGSEPNRSSRLRRALTFHYMSALSPLPWKVPVAPNQTEVATAQADYRDVFMVAGADPYAWKGVEDRSFPHLRRWFPVEGVPSAGERRTDRRLDAARRAQVAEALRRWNGDETEALDLLLQALQGIEAPAPS